MARMSPLRTLAASLLLFATQVPAAATMDDASESALEIQRARSAESEAAIDRPESGRFAAANPSLSVRGGLSNFGGIPNPLFIGVDDAAIPAELVDPTGVNSNVQVPLAVAYWGAAFDVATNTVYLSSGSTFHHWVVGDPAVTTIGPFVSANDGATLSMVTLGMHNGVLVAGRNISSANNPEGLYSVDPATGIATLLEAYADTAGTDIGGLDSDPVTGLLYGTNDAAANRGLVQIPLDGSGTYTVVAPYPAGETDIDGLAVGTDGRAYMIEDDSVAATGQIHVWDFALAAYQTPIPTPWPTSETFSAGAWIWEDTGEALECNAPPVAFESGIPATFTVVDNTGGTGIVWVASDDPACGPGNPTNGTGLAACADSDAAGTPAIPYDTELVSNTFDLSSFVDVTLTVAANYRDLGAGNDLFEIDARIGAGAWSNLLTWDEDHEPGDISLDLSSLAGNADVQIRFVYSGNGFDWWAQVDDVALTCSAVLPPDVAVDPASLEATLDPDQQTVLDLDITNNGGSDLDWTIEEADPVTVELTLADPTGLAPNGTVTLSVDDGVAENALGLTNGGQFIWLNRFTPPVYPITLNEVSVLFRSGDGINVGELVDIYVYEDADGNPANGANFVGSQLNAAVQALDSFSVYPLDTPINLAGPGDVLIAVVNRTAGTGAGTFVAALDQTATQTRSWIGIYTAGNPANPPVLPADSFFGLVDTAGFPGNWMVRGAGVLGGCAAPDDVPWLSVSPTAGTTIPAGTDTVDVTLDSTGLAAGDYEALVCVSSNDPDTPLVPVPVTLHVADTMPFLADFEEGDFSEWSASQP